MSFKDFLSQVKGPSRYLGNEINSIHKDPSKAKVKFALCFPDLYEVGMSHLGIQILYFILNQDSRVVCERVFAPDVDLEALLRKHNVPLGTWESGIPLKDCDIIGFSLQHELCYTNILNILYLGGIPIYARQRDERHPLIYAGGPVAVNPEPLSPFMDGFFIGDGEESVIEMVDVFLDWKHQGGSKQELLEEMARRISGFYLPFAFFPRYHIDGSIKEIEELIDGYHSVKRRVIPDLDKAYFPKAPIVPYHRPVHDRLSIEVARGCTQGCRFCQAGFIYRPVRERSPETVLKLVEEGLKNTGYEEVSLLSLSIGDYQPLKELLPVLMDYLTPQHVALSLPSLRVGTITPEMMAQISRVRRTGFTMAPEAGTQRLRNRINKKIKEEDLIETAKEVFARKWPSLKLYFMIGLPGETQEDIKAIAELARRLVKLGRHRFQVTVSISTFVPKAHTPFQWERQISLEESRNKINFLRKMGWKYGFKVRWHEPEQSFLEGVFSRGDRRLHEVILRAWLKGARFDSWRDHFQFSIWKAAFEDARLDPFFYLSERSKDDIMPWDKVDIGVSREFLWQEKLKAEREEITPDCRYEHCQGCGLCNFKTLAPVLHKEGFNAFLLPEKNKAENPARYRIVFRKVNEARFFGHLEMVNIFIRAFKRAGLSFAFTQGFHPLPKISFASALPVGIESECELMDIELVNEVKPEEIKNRVNRCLPAGLEIVQVKRIELKEKIKPPQFQRFIVDIKGIAISPDKIKAFKESKQFQYQLIKKGKVKQIDLKELIKELELDGKKIKVTIGISQKGGIKITEALKAILGLKERDIYQMRIVKIEELR